MSKDFCDYHSTKPAIWYCDECPRHYCGDCIVNLDEGPRTQDLRCPLCENRLTFLGAANTAKPFWTVAHRFFLYPFSTSGIGLMALMAFSSLLLNTGWIMLLLVALFMFAVVLKYCFAVIESVMTGNTKPPSITDAVGGDEEHLFLRFIGVMLVIGFVQAVSYELVGAGFGMLVNFVISLAMPAIVIFLAVEKRIGSALNPARLAWLIGSIGLPYLLVFFLSEAIFMGPALVLDIIADWLSPSLALPVVTVLTVYFTIVNFAMLGYVIFENQGKLGFTAAEDEDARLPATLPNRRKRLFADVNVLVREGRLEAAKQRFERERAEFRGDTPFLERYLQLLMQTGDRDALGARTDDYLSLLVDKGALPQALDAWRDARRIDTAYVPGDAGICHVLAECAYARNLSKEALALLVNLHKRAPRYSALGEAYRLAARIFRDGLGDDARARQLEQFVATKGLA